MKRFLIVIALLAATLVPALAQNHSHRGHKHQVHSQRYVARAATYRAVCSRGDLNRSFKTRAAAVAAARAHQRATKHQTSVRKQ